MTTRSRCNGRMADKGTSGLSILLSAEDRRLLHEVVRRTNDLLSTKVSQASVIRRAIHVYADYLEQKMVKFALADDDLSSFNTFLRSEKNAVYRANDIPFDGVDPAKEYEKKSAVAAKEAFAATRGMTPEEILNYIRTPRGGEQV
jgi:hypothetical protein